MAINSLRHIFPISGDPLWLFYGKMMKYFNTRADPVAVSWNCYLNIQHYRFAVYTEEHKAFVKSQDLTSFVISDVIR